APSTSPLFLGPKHVLIDGLPSRGLKLTPNANSSPVLAGLGSRAWSPKNVFQYTWADPPRWSLWKCVPAARLADIFHVIFARCICLSQESHLHASIRE